MASKPFKPSKLNLFFSELKRRKVSRLITLYAVVGLGVIEATDVIGGRFLLPDWIIRTVIGIVIGGFPISLILSWIFDFNLRGIEKTKALTPSEALNVSPLTWKPNLSSAILSILLIALSVTYCTVPRPNAFGIKKNDWIIISDLENNTGKEIFDKSLLHALTVTIDQSRYINVFPRDQLTAVLQRMRMDTVKRIDAPIALEIAEREGIKAVMVPTLSELGETFLLSIEMISPYTGQTLKSHMVNVENQSEILGALQKLASKARKDIGESLNSIHIQSVPLPAATTSSLEALKCFMKGNEAWFNDYKLDEAESLFQEAIRLDPEFAYAHAELGSLYYWLNNRTKGEESFAEALRIKDRLTEKEKLSIEARIERFRGNYDEAAIKYGSYLRKYPNSSSAWFSLGYAYMRLDRLDEAIDAFKKSQEIFNYNDPNTIINIATCYSGLGNYQLSIKNYLLAFELNPNLIMAPNLNHEFGFTYAYMGEFDKALEVFGKMIEGQIDQKARGYRSQALLNMYRGRFYESIKVLHESTIINKTLGYGVSELRDRLFLARAYSAIGDIEKYNKELNHAFDLLTTEGLEPWWFLLVGKLYIRDGNIEQADLILSQISKIIMEGNRVDNLAFNILKGEIELARGNNSEALGLFETGLKLRHDAFILESLAYYYYSTNNLDKAISTYKEIIENKSLGWEAQEYCVLAYYMLGKLNEEIGNREEAISNYEGFLNLWKDADEYIPILIDCQARYNNLSAEN